MSSSNGQRGKKVTPDISKKPFTATEQRILYVLRDGLDHSKDELRGVLDDELAGPACLQNHIKNIRKRLRPKGQDIVCVIAQGQKKVYRQVRKLNYEHPAD